MKPDSDTGSATPSEVSAARRGGRRISTQNSTENMDPAWTEALARIIHQAE